MIPAEPVAVLAMLVLAGLTGLPAQEVELQFAPSQLRQLEAAARSLAAAGSTGEMEEVLDLLVTLGQSEAARDRLRAQCESERVVASRVPRSLQAAVRQLTSAARRLSAQLPRLEKPQRRTLATCLVRIGGEVAEAHEILGHVATETGGWATPRDLGMKERRSEIQDAVRRARSLEVTLDVAESRHPTLMHLFGVPGLRLKWRDVEIHTSWPEARARRALSESLRAAALSKWVLTGSLELPELSPINLVLLGSKPDYLRALEFDRERGLITDQVAELAQNATTNFSSHSMGVSYAYTEGLAQAVLLAYWVQAPDTYLHGQPAQATLVAGHTSWICLAYLGQPIPLIARLVRESAGSESQRTAAQMHSDPTREQMRLLIGAGLRGRRSWLRYLVRRGEDEPWSRSMVRYVTDMDEDGVLKSTVVAEYLQELGLLGDVVEATRDAVGQPIDVVVASFEEALGQPLVAFEQNWRDWLLGERSLLARLEAPPTDSVSPSESEMLQHLNGLRDRAFRATALPPLPPVTLDRELSEGALLHSRYLAQHPDQAASWPEAHEEFADREGFTPAGAWAGSHSVIDPGAKTPRDAIDRWMGTFYHRLPLLEPNLLRVGHGQQDEIVVLDTGSMVGRSLWPYRVVWPPVGAEDVPRDFVPELPNPVPGEDQSGWGYPITLQLQPDIGRDPVPQLSMSLHVGRSDGPPVDCHFSSPFEPTNPDLVPDNVFCLIPEARLQPNATYVVVVQFPLGERMQWSFRTSGR